MVSGRATLKPHAAASKNEESGGAAFLRLFLIRQCLVRALVACDSQSRSCAIARTSTVAKYFGAFGTGLPRGAAIGGNQRRNVMLLEAQKNRGLSRCLALPEDAGNLEEPEFPDR